MRGSNCWFAVDSKSFEVLMEKVHEKLKEEREGRSVRSWEDEGKKFKLERHVNEAGRFVLCQSSILEAKRFCVVFLKEDEGEKSNGSKGASETRAFVDVAKVKAVWLEMRSGFSLGQRAMRQGGPVGSLPGCRWGESTVLGNGVSLSEKVGGMIVGPEEGYEILKAGRCIFSSGVEDKEEVERVLKRGVRRSKEKVLHLEKWCPEAGCFNLGKDLPKTLHLVVGPSCFSIRLWWEVPLWVSVVVLMRSFCRSELEKVRDGVEAGSCAERSVGRLCMVSGMGWSVQIEKKMADGTLSSKGLQKWLRTLMAGQVLGG
ncbi:hypothetical protein CK203_052782 [Vitis vinifera]|uniref:DUF4283 domain-containing protein n=1 Tax=Vitis vinifera TaxID=29760 RepID=A0A438FUS0_VITVI|nr:hypothetical protein CK203_052782 [Vitis vinifera]